MAAALSLAADPDQLTEEISTLAADASRSLFRLIGMSPWETCLVRFERAPDQPQYLIGARLSESRKWFLRELEWGGGAARMRPPICYRPPLPNAAELSSAGLPGCARMGSLGVWCCVGLS